MPRKAAAISPQKAVEMIEAQREKRRAHTAAYRQRQASTGARTVQLVAPDEPGALLLRRVAEAMRRGDRAALDALADQVRAYRSMTQPSLHPETLVSAEAA